LLCRCSEVMESEGLEGSGWHGGDKMQCNEDLEDDGRES
jgi:hypothetical protein